VVPGEGLDCTRTLIGLPADFAAHLDTPFTAPLTPAVALNWQFVCHCHVSVVRQGEREPVRRTARRFIPRHFPARTDIRLHVPQLQPR
jgi:hypothetical protein